MPAPGGSGASFTGPLAALASTRLDHTIPTSRTLRRTLAREKRSAESGGARHAMGFQEQKPLESHPENLSGFGPLRGPGPRGNFRDGRPLQRAPALRPSLPVRRCADSPASIFRIDQTLTH